MGERGIYFCRLTDIPGHSGPKTESRRIHKSNLIENPLTFNVYCAKVWFAPFSDRTYGNRTRMEGADGVWPTGQLVVWPAVG